MKTVFSVGPYPLTIVSDGCSLMTLLTWSMETTSPPVMTVDIGLKKSGNVSTIKLKTAVVSQH